MFKGRKILLKELFNAKFIRIKVHLQNWLICFKTSFNLLFINLEVTIIFLNIKWWKKIYFIDYQNSSKISLTTYLMEILFKIINSYTIITFKSKRI